MRKARGEGRGQTQAAMAYREATGKKKTYNRWAMNRPVGCECLYHTISKKETSRIRGEKYSVDYLDLSKVRKLL